MTVLLSVGCRPRREEALLKMKCPEGVQALVAHGTLYYLRGVHSGVPNITSRIDSEGVDELDIDSILCEETREEGRHRSIASSSFITE